MSKDTAENFEAFFAHPDTKIPKGDCLVIKDGKIRYCGSIKRSTVEPGCDMFLHPDDFKRLNERMKILKH